MSTLLAYLDAGSGSIIVSAIAGGFAAAAVAIKMYWNRFLQFLHIKKKDDAPEQPAAQAPAVESHEAEQPSVAETR
jgi:hypothetical protein